MCSQDLWVIVISFHFKFILLGFLYNNLIKLTYYLLPPHCLSVSRLFLGLSVSRMFWKSIDDSMHAASHWIYHTGVIIMYVLYIVLFLGLGQWASATVIQTFLFYFQLFICLFLIVRFHPFRTHILRPLDVQIIFGCAVLLLTNLGVVSIMESRASSIVNQLHLFR